MKTCRQLCPWNTLYGCKKPESESCILSNVAREKFEPKPQTNADHIRAMTDEELASFHLLQCPYMAGFYGECKYGWHDREQSCEECMLDWLKQPYKEDT